MKNETILINKALKDLRIAKQNRQEAPDMSCYHSAQAVEKILKAILQYYEKGFEHSHNVKKILEQVKGYIDIIPSIENRINKNIQPYTWSRIRYINYKDPTRAEARATFESAVHIVAALTQTKEMQSFYEAASFKKKFDVVREAQQLITANNKKQPLSIEKQIQQARQMRSETQNRDKHSSPEHQNRQENKKDTYQR